MPSPVPTVWTIGHSRHPWPVFLALLQQAGITTVIDVRSHPRSRFVPHANAAALARALPASGITYEGHGAVLGARSPDPAHHADGQVQYERIAAGTRFQQTLAALAARAAQERLALLCAEADPLVCHRTWLVGHHLLAHAITLTHLRGDGTVEDHAATRARLLRREARHLPVADADTQFAVAYARHCRRLQVPTPGTPAVSGGRAPMPS